MEVIMKSSSSHMAVVWQLSGSRRAVVRQSSGSSRAVVGQSSGSRQVVFLIILTRLTFTVDNSLPTHGAKCIHWIFAAYTSQAGFTESVLAGNNTEWTKK